MPQTSVRALHLGGLNRELADGGVLIAVDATHAAAWRGDEDKRFDSFVDIGSSDVAKKREQPLGGGRCLLLGCGVDTHVFRIGTTLGWLDFHPHDELDSKTTRLLTYAMTSMPTRGKPKRLGEVVIESGCLALVMAHAAGKATDAAIARAVAEKSKIRSYKGGSLVAVTPGTYTAFYDRLEREDDCGFFEGRLHLDKQP